MDNKSRTDSFKKNNYVEQILSLLEGNLSEVEENITRESDKSAYPPIFIFGCARSGTTVLHQYLIGNTECVYPSNFLSRFYYAPYLGGLYYKLFTDLDVRNELLGQSFERDKAFSSELGKTEGIHSPNEFWYFWRKHFDINLKGTIHTDNAEPENFSGFRNSIYALQNLFKGPFITKGMIANNSVDFLERIFPNAIFIHIRRDLLSNAISLYKARIKFFGTASKWYSFYPKSPDTYSGLSPEEQVVWQIIDTNKEIEQSIKRCKNPNVIQVDYPTFCKAPAQILGKLRALNQKIQIAEDPKPDQFTISASIDSGNPAEKKIAQIISELT